jgi:general secretion pathway protein H
MIITALSTGVARNSAQLSAAVKISPSFSYHRAYSAGFTLVEILLVLLIVGLIVGVASLSIDNRSGFNRRVALKEFGNHLNMVLSEAALSGKTWGVRLENPIDDVDTINYHWLKLDDNQRWVYATPYELEERTALPDETVVTLIIDNEPVAIETELPVEDNKKEEPDNPLKPQIVLQANGEVTPFTLSLAPAEENDRSNPGLELKVDSLGRLTLPAAEE